MSAKAVREHKGKKLLARHVKELSDGKHVIDDRSVLVTSETDLDKLPETEPWLVENEDNENNNNNQMLLVVKPDQLIKRRGKAGLVGIKLTYDQVKDWIRQRMNTDITIDGIKGCLDTFVIDPFVAHSQADEYYICIQSDRDGEEVLFYSEGGVDVGDVDSKAKRLHVGIDEVLTNVTIQSNNLLEGVPEARTESLSSFVATLFQVYRKLNFTYMEINPIVFAQDGTTIVPLDLAAKIDETAAFLNASDWGPGPLDLPPAFGRQEFPEEAYIRELDSKTGASLKLTVLNHTGKIWTMVRA
jgi:ATP citrate (pro-S)-lyase